MKKLFAALLVTAALITPAQAQYAGVCYYGRGCYTEDVRVPRPYGYGYRQYYVAPAPRYYRPYRPAGRDVMLGIGIGIGAAIIANGMYRRY